MTQRACLLIEHGNPLQTEKQHEVIVDGEKGETGRGEEELDGEHFISDDTCVLMAFAELQSTTMTNATTHHASQHWNARVQSPMKQRGMSAEQGPVGKHRADVSVLSSSLWCPLPVTARCSDVVPPNTNRKWNTDSPQSQTELFRQSDAFCTSSPPMASIQFVSYVTHVNHQRLCSY